MIAINIPVSMRIPFLTVDIAHSGILLNFATGLPEAFDIILVYYAANVVANHEYTEPI